MHRGKAWVLAGFGVLMFLLIGAFIRHSQSAEPHAPATVSRQRQTAITKQSSRKTQAASTPSQTAPPIAGSTAAQTSSSLAAFTFSAPTLQRSWSYMAYVPAGYDPHKRYPLVLMLHGMDGDDTNLVQLVDSKSLLDEAVNSTGHPAVVVFVDGGNSFYVDSPAEKMQTAIMQDLLPHLKQQFALLLQADAHAVGGVSMGGY
ncbi:Putative esterase, partial [Lacticaseibacillus paracasei subsp. paracasei Lpp14]